MKWSVIFLIILSVCLSAKPVKLTNQNFDDLVQEGKNGYWFLFFYAEWSPYSINFNATFLRLARNEKENIQYGSIDIMSERELAVRFRLHHYPTLILVHDGNFTEFKEKRQYELVQSFIHGGFKHSESNPIPSWPFPGIISFEKKIVQWDEWLSVHPLTLACIILVIGFILGSLIVNFVIVLFTKQEYEEEEEEEVNEVKEEDDEEEDDEEEEDDDDEDEDNEEDEEELQTQEQTHEKQE